MSKKFRMTSAYHRLLSKQDEFYERVGIEPTVVYIGIMVAHELMLEMNNHLTAPASGRIEDVTIAGMRLEQSAHLDKDDIVMSF